MIYVSVLRLQKYQRNALDHSGGAGRQVVKQLFDRRNHKYKTKSLRIATALATTDTDDKADETAKLKRQLGELTALMQ